MRLASQFRRISTASLLAAAIWSTASATGPSAPPVPNLYDAQQQIERYIASGQYERYFARVAASAQAYLEHRGPEATRPAIVLDIDETSLSNWPAYRVNGWGRIVNGGCDVHQGPCGLRAWQALWQSKALPPTLGLARPAPALVVAGFFISALPPDW